jgi:hypothetical protein
MNRDRSYWLRQCLRRALRQAVRMDRCRDRCRLEAAVRHRDRCLAHFAAAVALLHESDPA